MTQVDIEKICKEFGITAATKDYRVYNEPPTIAFINRRGPFTKDSPEKTDPAQKPSKIQ